MSINFALASQKKSLLFVLTLVLTLSFLDWPTIVANAFGQCCKGFIDVSEALDWSHHRTFILINEMQTFYRAKLFLFKNKINITP